METQTESPALIQSHVQGRWFGWVRGRGVGPGTPGRVQAQLHDDPVNAQAVVAHARVQGVAALEGMSWDQRARLLRNLAASLERARQDGVHQAQSLGCSAAQARWDLDAAVAVLRHLSAQSPQGVSAGWARGDPAKLLDATGMTWQASVRLAGRGVVLLRGHTEALHCAQLVQDLGLCLLAGQACVIDGRQLVSGREGLGVHTTLMLFTLMQIIVHAQVLPDGCLQWVVHSVDDPVQALRSGDVIRAYDGPHAWGAADVGELAAGVTLRVESAQAGVVVFDPGAEPRGSTPPADLRLQDLLAEMVWGLRMWGNDHPQAVADLLAPQAWVDEVGRILSELGCAMTVESIESIESIEPGDLRRGEPGAKAVAPGGAPPSPLVRVHGVGVRSMAWDWLRARGGQRQGGWGSAWLSCDDAGARAAWVQALAATREPGQSCQIWLGPWPHGTVTPHAWAADTDGADERELAWKRRAMARLLGGAEEALRRHLAGAVLMGGAGELSQALDEYIPGSPITQSRVHPFELNFDELTVGASVLTHRRTVTEADIVAFAALSGDHFYLHVDDIAARASAFGKRIAHGYFVVSAAAGLFVRPAPGPVLANYGLEALRFIEPVGIGDTLQVRLTCKRKTEKSGRAGGASQGMVIWDVQVTNQWGKAVARFDVHTLVARRQDAGAGPDMQAERPTVPQGPGGAAARAPGSSA